MTAPTHDAEYDADEHGWFGDFGGRFMPEALVAALDELTVAWQEAMADPTFLADFDAILRDYAGVPEPALRRRRGSPSMVGARILLKREDLNHTGAHKIRNVLGQALLTKRMGKTRVIAETGAGQHGVASATAAAYFGLDCTVYMGSVDTKRQALNVARMQLLGAKVVPVDSGSAHAQGRHQRGAARLGRQRRPHGVPVRHRRRPAPVPEHGPRLHPRHRRRGPGPVPRAVRRAAGRHRRLRRRRLQRDRAVHGVPRRRGRRIYGFEPGGDGVETGRHAATIHAGDSGVLHGARTFVLQDEDGQTIESHSISAGLDYPGVGPQHAHLAASGRGDVPAGHRRRGDGRDGAARPHRGHHPARSSPRTRSPARSRWPRLASKGPDAIVLVNLSGRGDKDMDTALEWFGLGTDRSRRAASSVYAPPSRRPARDGRAALVGYLPAGFPTSRARIEALQGDGRRRLRRDRDRAALQRPGDGRPDDPGRRPAGARRRRPHRRRAPRPSRRSPPPAPRPW